MIYIYIYIALGDEGDVRCKITQGLANNSYPISGIFRFLVVFQLILYGKSGRCRQSTRLDIALQR